MKKRRAKGSFFSGCTACCAAFIVAAVCASVSGDNVGIDKGRLIEESPDNYVLEVDTTSQLARLYRKPILPVRFELVGQPERERIGGGVIMRFRFRSTDGPLDREDLILLPWNRPGLFLTAQWNDGTINQALFLGNVQGIPLPVSQLIPVQETMSDIVHHHVWVGLTHAFTSPLHWIFVLGMCLIARSWKLVRLMLLVAAGHSLSLVLLDAGLPGVPILIVDVCFVVAALLAARSAMAEYQVNGEFDLMMLILGVLQGLGYAELLSESGVASQQRLSALFAFNMGTDLMHVSGAVLVGGLVSMASSLFSPDRMRPIVSAATGSVAFALILLLTMSGETAISLAADIDRKQEAYDIPDLSGSSQRQGARPKPAATMTDPLMSYLTIEPYEVRHEVLITGRQAASLANLSVASDVIAVREQETWKTKILETLHGSFEVTIDGKPGELVLQRVDFVTQSADGIFPRKSPVPEPLGKAVLGSMFVFQTDDLARNATLKWNLLDENLDRIPVTTTDPFGGREGEATKEQPTVSWENRLTGYRAPKIIEVDVVQATYPVASTVLSLVSLVLFFWLGRIGRTTAATLVLSFGLAGATLAYPFVRMPLDLPGATSLKADSSEASSVLDDLLTNVYRSFDLRGEDAIYDRLALTVTGDQLKKIYLENVKSLELEDRGGARAKVDEVEIIEIRGVRSDGSSGLLLESVWTVAGSVTHFGHTHYRRNRFDAEVNITPVNGKWKILNIEVADHDREL